MRCNRCLSTCSPNRSVCLARLPLPANLAPPTADRATRLAASSSALKSIPCPLPMGSKLTIGFGCSLDDAAGAGIGIGDAATAATGLGIEAGIGAGAGDGTGAAAGDGANSLAYTNNLNRTLDILAVVRLYRLLWWLPACPIRG